MPSAFTDVSAVIVTFNSADTIGACLDALPDAVSIVIVDNASTDETCAMVARLRPEAVIVRNARNEGFGRANNQGMARVTTRYGLVLNPDALVGDEALGHLLAASERNPGSALVAPLLLRPNGGIELPVMGPQEKNHHPIAVEPDGDFCTWFMTGAVLLADMDAWRKVGGFDEAIFLYNEDADLALRVNALGYTQIVTPAARVLHVGGGSVPKTMRVRWIKDWHMTWSRFYYEAKHGGDEAALKAEARALARKQGLRALMYVFLLNPKKVVGNAAKALAARAYAKGKPSRP